MFCYLLLVCPAPCCNCDLILACIVLLTTCMITSICSSHLIHTVFRYQWVSPSVTAEVLAPYLGSISDSPWSPTLSSPSSLASSSLHRTGHWYRSRVNDLRALAGLISAATPILPLGSSRAFSPLGGVVICGVLLKGQREMAANWMYSLSRFGGVKEALVFSFDEDSLEECLSLGFVCYNGMPLVPSPWESGYPPSSAAQDLSRDDAVNSGTSLGGGHSVSRLSLHWGL